MNKQEERALVKETKALIKEVEAGNTEHAAWVAVQDRVQQLYEGCSQVAVGKLLGKSERWVGDMLKWNPRRGPDSSPFSRPDKKGTAQKVQRARAALADPAARKEVIENLPSEHVHAVADAARIEADKRYIHEEIHGGKERKPSPGDKSSDLMVGFGNLRRDAEQLLDRTRQHGVDDLPEETREGLAERGRKTIAAITLLVEYIEGDDVMDEIQRFLDEKEKQA